MPTNPRLPTGHSERIKRGLLEKQLNRPLTEVEKKVVDREYRRGCLHLKNLLLSHRAAQAVLDQERKP